MQQIPDAETTLSDRVNEVGESQVANDLGLTFSAIWQMLRNRRQIYLKRIRGQWHYAELKPWRRGSKTKR